MAELFNVHLPPHLVLPDDGENKSITDYLDEFSTAVDDSFRRMFDRLMITAEEGVFNYLTVTGYITATSYITATGVINADGGIISGGNLAMGNNNITGANDIMA